LPNLPKLGPRLGKRLPALRKALGAADPAALLRQLGEIGQASFDLPGIAPPDNIVALDRDDIQVRLQAKPGWAAAQGKACVVVLNTELTPQLIAEGLARDIVRAIQDHRKAESTRPTVHLFTDGACSGNPGPGGWAYILRHPSSGKEVEKSGGERQTTNNRMELMAVIAGLSALKKPAQVELFTDSQYVGKG